VFFEPLATGVAGRVIEGQHVPSRSVQYVEWLLHNPRKRETARDDQRRPIDLDNYVRQFEVKLVIFYFLGDKNETQLFAVLDCSTISFNRVSRGR
jgi:hypothetical protein